MMIDIDASFGEAGGQMLRIAVAYSMLSGISFRMRNIRKKRPRPGLKRQHLFILKSAYHLMGKKFRGRIGQETVEFLPGTVIEKKLFVDMRTAASITLFLQSLLPVFLYKGVEARIVGGTDVPFSPTMDYFIHILLPFFRKFGEGSVAVVRRGYYPAGGGVVEVIPSNSGYDFSTISIPFHRNSGCTEIIARASVHLRDRNICYRLEKLCNEKGIECSCSYEDSDSPGGSVVCIRDHGKFCTGSDGLMERGKRLEDILLKVAERRDRNFQDNIVFFISVFGGKAWIGEMTPHTESAMFVARHFGSDIFYSGGWIEASPVEWIGKLDDI